MNIDEPQLLTATAMDFLCVIRYGLTSYNSPPLFLSVKVWVLVLSKFDLFSHHLKQLANIFIKKEKSSQPINILLMGW